MYGFLDYLGDEGLPFPLDFGHVELAALYEVVDYFGAADGSGDNYSVFSRCIGILWPIEILCAVGVVLRKEYCQYSIRAVAKSNGSIETPEISFGLTASNPSLRLIRGLIYIRDYDLHEYSSQPLVDTHMWPALLPRFHC